MLITYPRLSVGNKRSGAEKKVVEIAGSVQRTRSIDRISSQINFLHRTNRLALHRAEDTAAKRWFLHVVTYNARSGLATVVLIRFSFVFFNFFFLAAYFWLVRRVRERWRCRYVRRLLHTLPRRILLSPRTMQRVEPRARLRARVQTTPTHGAKPGSESRSAWEFNNNITQYFVMWIFTGRPRRFRVDFDSPANRRNFIFFTGRERAYKKYVHKNMYIKICI